MFRPAIRALRSSNESADASRLPPKTIPSAEMNSPASVAAAQSFPCFLKAKAASRSRKIAMLCNNRATNGARESGAFTFSRAQTRASCGRAARVSGDKFDNPGRTRAACPIFFFFNVAIISAASCASFRTIACRFRPRAPSIAAIYSGSTSRFETKAPASAGWIRDGSSSPLRTACEPCASPSPSSLS